MPSHALSLPELVARLDPPSPGQRVSMVLDTDTYNEIDDQFALVYSLLAPNRLDVEAVYAAPFHNNRSTGPGDGMEKSYDEILRLLDRLGHAPDGFAFRGSTSYLPAADKPVESQAARDLIKRAHAERQTPLYVVAVGAITNVASALLLDPTIAEKIVVVWLGGNPPSWPSTREFNLMQDVPASRLVFDCGVPLVHVPCKNVAEHARTTVPEVERYVKGHGRVGDYLYEIFAAYHADHFAWSKVLWDMVPVAFLIHPPWVPSVLCHSPVLNPGLTWSHDPSRHFVRMATAVNRDAMFRDFFTRLQERAGN